MRARWLAWGSFAATLLALLTWFLRPAAASELSAGSTPVATATGLTFLGLAVALMLSEGGPRAARQIAVSCALLTLLICGATLLKHGLGVAPWLLRLPSSGDGGGQATGLAMVTLLLLAVAVLLPDRGAAPRLAGGLGLVACSLGYLSLMAWLYAPPAAGLAGGDRPMVLLAALLSCTLGAAVLLSRPEHGLVAILTGGGVGGRLGRRLLPACLAPMAIGWLRVAGERSGLFDQAYATAAGMTIDTLLVLFVIGWGARLLNRVDRLQDELAERTRSAEERAAALAQSEEDVRRQSELLAAVLDNAGEGIAVVDADGRFLVWNQACRAMLGDLPDGNLLSEGSRDYTLYHLDRRTPLSEEEFPLRRAMRGEPVDHELLYVLRLDDEPIWMEATARAFRQAGGHGAVVVLSDVTVRRAIEEQLRESEGRFRGAFEFAPTGVALTSLEGVFIRVNEAFSQLIGYSPAELAGRTVAELTHPDDFDADREAMRGLAAGELEVCRRDQRFRHCDGRSVWVRLNSTVVRGSYEEPLYFVSQVLDLTSEAEARRALAESEHRFRTAVGNLLDGVTLFSVARDEDGQAVDLVYEYMNRAAERSLWRPPGEVLGHRLSEVFPSHRAYLADWLAVAETGEPYVAAGLPVEEELDGRLRRGTMDVQVARLGDGVVVAWRDTTGEAAAREALRASEERFRAAFEGMTEAACLLSAVRDAGGRVVDLRYEYINPVARRNLWRPAEEALGRTMSELFPHVVETGALARYAAVVDSGEPVTEEAAYREGLVDGVVRSGYYDVRVVPMGDGVAHFYREVSDRVRSEQSLRESEERFRMALDTMRDCFVLLRAVRDADGAIVDFEYTYANQAAAQNNGMSAEAMVGRRLLDVLPAHRDELLPRYVEVVETGEPLALTAWEYEDRFAGGQTIRAWFDVWATRFGDGLAYAWRDVTDRVRAQDSVRESEELFRSAFEEAALGMALLDLDGRCLRVNRILLELLNTAEEQLLGHGYEQFVHPEERTDWLARTADLLSGHLTSDQAEMRWLVGDRQPVWVQVTRALVRNAEGEAWCVIMQVQDIGPRKLAEQELAQRQLDLARSNQELAQFAHIASHDLQEPMRKIQVLGDRLQAIAGDQLGDAGRDLVGRLRSSARRMSALLEALLQYSRLANQPLRYRPVDLDAVVAEVGQELAPEVAGSGAVVAVGPLPTIEGDPTLLRELLRALLSNALKFRRPDAAPRIRIECQVDEPDEVVELRVEDNGIGFEAKHLQRIFHPFQQLNPSDDYPGTGMGLAMAHRIVQRHNGEISAESRPGEGTTFIVRFPVHCLRMGASWVSPS